MNNERQEQEKVAKYILNNILAKYKQLNKGTIDNSDTFSAYKLDTGDVIGKVDGKYYFSITKNGLNQVVEVFDSDVEDLCVGDKYDRNICEVFHYSSMELNAFKKAKIENIKVNHVSRGNPEQYVYEMDSRPGKKGYMRNYTNGNGSDNRFLERKAIAKEVDHRMELNNKNTIKRVINKI